MHIIAAKCVGKVWRRLQEKQQLKGETEIVCNCRNKVGKAYLWLVPHGNTTALLLMATFEWEYENNWLSIAVAIPFISHSNFCKKRSIKKYQGET